jgi:hypothetical protein
MADEKKKRTIDERLDALVINLELLWHSVQTHALQIKQQTANIDKLVAVTNQDAIAIRSLARIAEAYEGRIKGLEGG